MGRRFAGLMIGLGLALALGGACSADADSAEAGVGANRAGCEDPDSHSLRLADHSCVCEAGYEWCSDAIDDFDCCPSSAELGDSETGDPVELPSEACDADKLEALVCVPGAGNDGDPSGGVIWACNGERWVEVPSYAKFECLSAGYPFVYGCRPAAPEPSFVCGFGPGTQCDPGEFPALCVDEDIIDSCVWGRRTVDRCSRLCAEVEAFGPGFDGGACSQPTPDPTPDPNIVASCECCVGC